jgi:hypothetical protein
MGRRILQGYQLRKFLFWGWNYPKVLKLPWKHGLETNKCATLRFKNWTSFESTPLNLGEHPMRSLA